jgi:hypothetical protein
VDQGRQGARSNGRGCPSARSPANAVRLKLHALAYYLANFMRTLAMPEPIRHRSPTSLREKLQLVFGCRLVVDLVDASARRSRVAEAAAAEAEARTPRLGVRLASLTPERWPPVVHLSGAKLGGGVLEELVSEIWTGR